MDDCDHGRDDKILICKIRDLTMYYYKSSMRTCCKIACLLGCIATLSRTIKLEQLIPRIIKVYPAWQYKPKAKHEGRDCLIKGGYPL